MINFLRRTITIRRQVQGETSTTTELVAPKHGSERVVHVPEELVNLLAAHVRDIGVWGGEEWLFGSGGGVLNRNSALWRRVRTAAGIPRRSRCTI